MSNVNDWLASKWKNSARNAEKSTERSPQRPTPLTSSERSIFEKSRNIIAAQLGLRPNEIEIDSKFMDDLGADSLDGVELIMAFEEEFNIEIPDEVAANMKSVRDVVKYINSH